LSKGVARSLGTVRLYLIRHRDARAGEELHRHLSLLSDTDLARRGLDREQLAQLLGGRFEEPTAPRDRA
jgi:hypothetical protein